MYELYRKISAYCQPFFCPGSFVPGTDQDMPKGLSTKIIDPRELELEPTDPKISALVELESKSKFNKLAA